MAGELKDRLTDLAEVTPVGTPPLDLWARGVRRRRASRAGRTLLVAALVLVLGVGAWTWHTSRTGVTPVAPHGAAHLPDRFYPPSPWLKPFASPPGQLVAVGTTTRKTLFHTSTQAYGVTASGGQYGFLDLPRLVGGGEPGRASPALSPNGRLLAYWTSGTPSGTPNTVIFGATVTGVALYDTATGRVRTATIPTRHGLAPESLAWSDDRTLVLGYGQIQGSDHSPLRSGSYGSTPLRMWRVEDAAPTFLPSSKTQQSSGMLTTGPGFVVTADNWVLWPRDPSRDLHFRGPNAGSTAAVSPHPTELAQVPGNSNPNRLQVGRIEGPRAMPLHAVTSSRQYYRPVVWTDDQHVAALARGPVNEGGDTRINLVDVGSGATRELVGHLPGGGNGWNQVSFASDLLTAPSAPGQPPPDPPDLRALAIGLGVGVLLLGVLLLLAWRSRVRRA